MTKKPRRVNEVHGHVAQDYYDQDDDWQDNQYDEYEEEEEYDYSPSGARNHMTVTTQLADSIQAMVMSEDVLETLAPSISVCDSTGWHGHCVA